MIATPTYEALENKIIELEKLNSKYKKIETTLNISKQIFDLHSTHTPLAMIEWDTNFQVKSWNPAAEKIFGYTEKEILGKHGSLIIPEKFKTDVNLVWENLLLQKGGTRSTNQNITKDGAQRYCEWFNTPIVDEKGKTISVYSLAQDITRQKRADEEWHKLATVVKHCHDLINIATLDGKMMFLNEAGGKMLGIDPDSIRKHNIIDVIPESQVNLVQEKILPALRNGESWKGDFQYQNLKTGKLIDVNVMTFSIDGPNTDTPMFLANVSQDISYQKHAELEKRKFEDQLLQAQKLEAVGTLASGIAHDFNNILFPIIGLPEMLLEKEIDPSIKTDLKEILKAGKRARDLVSQILTFSRKNQKTLEPLNLQSITREAIKFARATLPTNIKIKSNIDQNCDPVMGNINQFHQVMVNLVTNAFHAMENSKGVLSISLQQEIIKPQLLGYNDSNNKNYICLRIEDTGIGMDSNTLAKIFLPYFTTKENDKGSGLGLAIVHGIIKSFGGQILTDSQVGKGSSFKIYLPIVDAKIEEKNHSKQNFINGNQKRILLVDDERPVTMVLKKILELSGFKVSEFNDSLTAFKCFKKSPEKYDLIISDLTMPNMTGDLLCSEISKLKPTLPIILLTGYNKSKFYNEKHRFGINTVLKKPVSTGEILTAIHELI